MLGKKNKHTHDNVFIRRILDWAYAKAITGFGGVDSAYELGNDYLKSDGTLDQKVDKLIRWQISGAATSGFLTGFGGLAVMPFSIPANVASVIYIQIRMIAAIAYMGGYDLQSDQVKTMVFVSMVGNGAKEILKDMGIKAGEKVMTEVIRNASLRVLNSVNGKVESSLLSKLGNKGLSKLGKAIPLMGGVIGAAFDASTTAVVGKMAKHIFVDSDKTNLKIETKDISNQNVR